MLLESFLPAHPPAAIVMHLLCTLRLGRCRLGGAAGDASDELLQLLLGLDFALVGLGSRPPLALICIFCLSYF